MELDWYKPYMYTQCTSEEFLFREEYALPQLIEAIDVAEFASFKELVLQGHKDPLEEWEKAYDKNFPMSSD